MADGSKQQVAADGRRQQTAVAATVDGARTYCVLGRLSAHSQSSYRAISAFVIAKKFVAIKSASKEYVDVSSIPADPVERKQISDYHPNQLDEIRRAYLIKGPCQPRSHNFPWRNIGNRQRRFNLEWFDEFPNWLEYSMKEDKAYCLCCYLFRDHFNDQKGGGSFINRGFSGWNKKYTLDDHVGGVNSFHNLAVSKCNDLMNAKQAINLSFHKQTQASIYEYKIRLNASIDGCRYLLHQGLPFRGHDEPDKSLNKGNFLELIKVIAGQTDLVGDVVLKNAPKNNQMVSPVIQKDIIHCFAQEILQKILEEINGDCFSLMVDESSDVSGKEQMAVVLRFVDSYGNVKERFICVIHVQETSALSLKYAIDNLFAKLDLSFMTIRGQGYDGASNMSGEFHGLKALILNENKSAYYVHCFSHQLQLTLVNVAVNNLGVANFFRMVSCLLNVVEASCKRKDMIRERQAKKLEEAIASGLIDMGKGLNQELSLIRAGDTHWGSHYKSLMNLEKLFSTITEVLNFVLVEGRDAYKKSEAEGLLKYFKSFTCVFYLQMMLLVLSISNELTIALQRKDEDILNVMSLVRAVKERLQEERDHGWEGLLQKVTTFCNKHEINCLDMDASKKSRGKGNTTNDFHYRVETFYATIDMQLSALNERFNEINFVLLLCIACLSPTNNFCAFDAKKLVRLAQFYPDDFSCAECSTLESQLPTYILDIRGDDRFSRLNGLNNLSTMFVETRKHLIYPLVYQLLKLALVLPVTTATVERCFSAMKIIKTDLRNRIHDDFMNECLVCFIETELFNGIKNDAIIERFQKMKTRRMSL